MSKRSFAALLFALGGGQAFGTLVALGALMSWEPLNPFRYLTDPVLLQLNTPELNLLIGVTTYLVSTVFLMALFETRLRARNFCGRASLLGLVPLVGAVSLFFFRKKNGAPSKDTTSRAGGQLFPAAIVAGLTGLMVIFGVYFVTQIGKPRESVTSVAHANFEAYSAVKKIFEAQKSYKLKDWDGDGEKEFALFVAHLWRTGRKKSEPVDVGLLSEELAVARNVELSYHGYSFRNLHHQQMVPRRALHEAASGESHLRELNYREQWALIAEPQFSPEREDKNRSLEFLAFSDGRIFARQRRNEKIESIPFEYEKQWSLVSSVADIENLQRSGGQNDDLPDSRH